jgi:ribosome-associated protein
MSSTNLRNLYQLGNIDTMQPTNIEQLKDIVLTSIDNDQGSEIILCDLKGKADFARYMIIVSGRSNRHVCSMIENLMDRLKKINVASTASGLENGQWVLLDAGDIIVNAFLPEYRGLYKLEELWG